MEVSNQSTQGKQSKHLKNTLFIRISVPLYPWKSSNFLKAVVIMNLLCTTANLQEKWPNSREDGKESHHFNLTQIPSDVEIDNFGFSLNYQIAIIFEIGENKWKKDTVMPLVGTRLKDMYIKKMDMISEPIALIYYHKLIKWSTVINYIWKLLTLTGYDFFMDSVHSLSN